MILESIVTTVDDAGRINLAPMGPKIEPGDWDHFTLRPFAGSRTYRNLLSTGRAVIHVTDDVGLFAHAAVEELECGALVEPVADGRWWRLTDCHRWFAVEVIKTTLQEPRAELGCRVAASGIVRPFFGFNRAMHAVIETAILATRKHLIDTEVIESELQRLRPLIEKTAGPVEQEAFEFLCRSIREEPDA